MGWDLDNENVDDMDISTQDNPLKEILRSEISKEIENMLSCLSEEDKKISTKLYFEDKSMSEISKDTGLSKSVLYNRLSRGRREMRNKTII